MDRERCSSSPSSSYLSSRLRECSAKVYLKYSSSQNYYYTREVNEIIFKQEGTRSLILFRDFQTFDNSDEEQFFQKIYPLPVCEKKMIYLTEYYKFHNDIPRLFMEPQNHVLNYFHDKHRKIKYLRITKMLQQHQQQQQSSPGDGDVQHHEPVDDVFDEALPMERLLAPLDSFLNESISVNKEFNKHNELFFMNTRGVEQHRQKRLLQDEEAASDKSGNTIHFLHKRLRDLARSKDNHHHQHTNTEYSSFTNSFMSVVSKTNDASGRGQAATRDFGNLEKFLNFCEKKQLQQHELAQQQPRHATLLTSTPNIFKKKQTPTIEIPTASTFLQQPSAKGTTTQRTISIALNSVGGATAAPSLPSLIARTQPSLIVNAVTQRPSKIEIPMRVITAKAQQIQDDKNMFIVINEGGEGAAAPPPPSAELAKSLSSARQQTQVSATPASNIIPQHLPRQLQQRVPPANPTPTMRLNSDIASLIAAAASSSRKVPMLDFHQSTTSLSQVIQPSRISGRESASSVKTSQDCQAGSSNNFRSSDSGRLTKAEERDFVQRLFAEKHASREGSSSSRNKSSVLAVAQSLSHVRGSETERVSAKSRPRSTASSAWNPCNPTVAAVTANNNNNNVSHAMDLLKRQSPMPPPSLFAQKVSPRMSPFSSPKKIAAVTQPSTYSLAIAPAAAAVASTRLSTSPLRAQDKKSCQMLTEGKNHTSSRDILDMRHSNPFLDSFKPPPQHAAAWNQQQSQSNSRSSSALRGQAGNQQAQQSSSQGATISFMSNEAAMPQSGSEKPRGKSVHFLQMEPRYFELLQSSMSHLHNYNANISQTIFSNNNKSGGGGGNSTPNPPPSPSQISKSKSTHGSSAGYLRMLPLNGIHSSLSCLSQTTAESSGQGMTTVQQQLRRSTCQENSMSHHLRNSQELAKAAAAPVASKSPKKIERIPNNANTAIMSNNNKQLGGGGGQTMNQQKPEQQLRRQPATVQLRKREQQQQVVEYQVVSQKPKKSLPHNYLQQQHSSHLSTAQHSRKSSLTDLGYALALPPSSSSHPLSKSIHTSQGGINLKNSATGIQQPRQSSREGKQPAVVTASAATNVLRRHFTTATSMNSVLFTQANSFKASNYNSLSNGGDLVGAQQFSTTGITTAAQLSPPLKRNSIECVNANKQQQQTITPATSAFDQQPFIGHAQKIINRNTYSTSTHTALTQRPTNLLSCQVAAAAAAAATAGLGSVTERQEAKKQQQQHTALSRSLYQGGQLQCETTEKKQKKAEVVAKHKKTRSEVPLSFLQKQQQQQYPPTQLVFQAEELHSNQLIKKSSTKFSHPHQYNSRKSSTHEYEVAQQEFSPLISDRQHMLQNSTQQQQPPRDIYFQKNSSRNNSTHKQPSSVSPMGSPYAPVRQQQQHDPQQFSTNFVYMSNQQSISQQQKKRSGSQMSMEYISHSPRDEQFIQMEIKPLPTDFQNELLRLDQQQQSYRSVKRKELPAVTTTPANSSSSCSSNNNSNSNGNQQSINVQNLYNQIMHNNQLLRSNQY